MTKLPIGQSSNQGLTVWGPIVLGPTVWGPTLTKPPSGQPSTRGPNSLGAYNLVANSPGANRDQATDWTAEQPQACSLDYTLKTKGHKQRHYERYSG